MSDYMGDYLGGDLGALGGSALPNGPVTSAVNHPQDMGGLFDFFKKGNKSSTSHLTLPVLSKGSKGLEVEQVQSLLNINVDGDFGFNTETAVKSFQTANGIPSTGVVDAQTWAKLIGENYKDPSQQAANREQAAQTFQQGASAISDLIKQFAVPPANAQELMQAPVSTPAPQKGFPWAWVVGGLAGVVVVGGVLYYVTRD